MYVCEGGGHDPMTFNMKKIKRFVLMFTSVCAPACMCLMCTDAPPPRPEEGTGFLEAEGTGSWNYLMWVLETELKSLQDQQMLLGAEPSFQPCHLTSF